MSRLLTGELWRLIPRLREQEHSKDPTVYAVFNFPGSGWKWFVTEGEKSGDEFIFFGYVIGFEAELGYFTLSELEGVDICGIKVEQVENFETAPLKQCLELYSGELKTSGWQKALHGKSAIHNKRQ